MGQQPYLTCLALGRSAYEAPKTSSASHHATSGSSNGAENSTTNDARAEPQSQEWGTDSPSHGETYVQQYDRRGRPRNPKSRESTRAIMRAGNEILVAAGYVARGADRSVEQRKTLKIREEQVEDETTAGVQVAIASSLVSYFFNQSTGSFRNQTSISQPSPTSDFNSLYRVRRNYFGTLNAHFGGLITYFISCLSELGIAFVLGDLNRKVDPHAVDELRPTSPDSQSEEFSLPSSSGYYIRSFAYWSLFCYPLRALSLMQNLGLLSDPHSLLPSLQEARALLPFSSVFLQHAGFPSSRTPLGVRGRIGLFISSPLPLFWLHHILYDSIDEHLGYFLRRVLPKPDNPDLSSVESAKNNELGDYYLIGIDPLIESNVNFTFSGISDYVSSRLHSCISWSRNMLQRDVRTPNEESVNRLSDNPVAPSGQEGPIEEPGQRANPPSENDAGNQHNSDSDDPTTLNRHRSGSISMSLEAESAEELRSNHGSHDIPSELDKKSDTPKSVHFSKHRVSALTSHAATFLACNISALVSTWALVPLERLALRSLLVTAVSAAATSPDLEINYGYINAIGSAGVVYFGLPSGIVRTGNQSLESASFARPLLVSYAYCLGLDIASRLLVYQAGYALNIAVGRSFYHWGNRRR